MGKYPRHATPSSSTGVQQLGIQTAQCRGTVLQQTQTLPGHRNPLTAIKNIIEKDIYLSTNVLEGYKDDEVEV